MHFPNDANLRIGFSDHSTGATVGSSPSLASWRPWAGRPSARTARRAGDIITREPIPDDFIGQQPAITVIRTLIQAERSLETIPPKGESPTTIGGGGELPTRNVHGLQKNAFAADGLVFHAVTLLPIKTRAGL